MEGYVSKRGKRSGSRVRRYMRLQHCQLSNHHAKDAQATWTIDVRDGVITANSRRHRIAIEMHTQRLNLYVDSSHECDLWYEALTNAKSRALLLAHHDDRDHGVSDDGGGAVEVENNKPVVVVVCKKGDGTHDEPEEHLQKLFKGFKVVVPPSEGDDDGDDDDGVKAVTHVSHVRQAQQIGHGGGAEREVDAWDDQTCSCSSDNDHEEGGLRSGGMRAADMHHGADMVYEETPVSMIFKEFNFPSCK